MQLQKPWIYKTGIFRALAFFSERLNSDYKQVSCRIHLDNSIPNQDSTEPSQHNPPETKKTLDPLALTKSQVAFRGTSTGITVGRKCSLGQSLLCVGPCSRRDSQTRSPPRCAAVTSPRFRQLNKNMEKKNTISRYWKTQHRVREGWIGSLGLADANYYV